MNPTKIQDGKKGIVWPENTVSLRSFIKRVYEAGTCYYRDLPWRYLDDAYGVLVSEVMLQQTQVSRVEAKWQRFIDLFPCVEALACADTSAVLDEWQGLGYNRRALSLKRTCEICMKHYDCSIPQNADLLLQLPGIGPATAAGVMCFVYHKPVVYIETNVRTVFLHDVFPNSYDVCDSDIAPLAKLSCPDKNPHTWYYALLDYGAELKKNFTNPSRRSAHHTKQDTFQGSRRQKRAEILRYVLYNSEVTIEGLVDYLCIFEKKHGREDVDPAVVSDIAFELVKEGFFHFENGYFRS